MNSQNAISEIVNLLDENPLQELTNTIQILVNVTNKILSDRSNSLYRTLFLKDEIFLTLLTTFGGMECLFYMGFEEDEDKLILQNEYPLDKLEDVHKVLLEKMKFTKQKLDFDTKILSLKINNDLISEIKVLFENMLIYKNEKLLQEARNIVPYSALKTKAVQKLEELKDASQSSSEPVTINDCLLYELLVWFKRDFFVWVDRPECNFCKSPTVPKNKTLTADGLLVEHYACTNCSQFTKFIRYDNPGMLLKTRCGRCGEWAKAFMLISCAVGFDTRLVCDSAADHIWIEVYSSDKKRWVHCDPCEAALDTPLMYEVGWKKRLAYVIAYSPYDVQDVTWRYSKNHKETLKLRKKCSEIQLVNALIQLRTLRQRHLPEKKRNYLEQRTIAELIELLQEKQISDNDKKERQSGSLLWRMQRGETTGESEKNVGYIWQPNLNCCYLCVRYCPVQDQYESMNESKEVLSTVKKWQNGVYKSNSVFRKEEYDWKTVYLTRSENTSKGSVVWKFASPSEKIYIDKIDIKFVYTTFENGKVSVQLVNSLNETANGFRQIQHNVPQNVKFYSTSEFKGTTEFYLIAELSEGRGDVAWQHAQLFRQSTQNYPENSTDYPFVVTVTFTK